MKPCKSKHTYFTPADFTAEEVARKNKLAMAVIVGKRRICKICGFESKFKSKGDR